RAMASEGSRSDVEPRHGMPNPRLSRDEFRRRYLRQFIDPAFDRLRAKIDEVEAIAWDGYSNGRKAPHTRKAAAGFADPSYDLSLDGRDARAAILAAQHRHADPAAPSRILIVNGSPRSEHTCPGEMSKSWRLVETAQQAIETWARDDGHRCEID